MNKLLILLFKLLPKNLLSRAFGHICSLKVPLFSTLIRNLFIKAYHIDVDEAEHPLVAYSCLSDFFIRRLKPEARVIAASPIVSPVDGTLSQTGILKGPDFKMIQAKGRNYSLAALIGDRLLASKFEEGTWLTIYLAPSNYHRIHNPVKANLVQALYLPGTLWPVNKISVENVDELFCVNERIVSHLITPDDHDLLVVKVGATNVGKISLAYTDHFISNQPHNSKEKLQVWRPMAPIPMEKGVELGCFELGSTVVVVLSAGLAQKLSNLRGLKIGHALKMGQEF
jgi:phosphatidylserine decarboxylase